ncbi:MAG: hypothetical protein AB8F95_00860 [Bacteroidia bacterium]
MTRTFLILFFTSILSISVYDLGAVSGLSLADYQFHFDLPAFDGSGPKALGKVDRGGPVKAEKELAFSTKKEGHYNVVLTLSNGIIFSYQDGEVKAALDDELLEIEGEYLVYSSLGVARISFDPKSGELWWVFDKGGEQ